MDIIDRNRTRIHPAQIAIRRANANRAARQAASKPANAASTPTTRAELVSAIESAWSRKFPTFRIGDFLAQNYGVVLLNSRWLSDAKLREIHDRIIAA